MREAIRTSLWFIPACFVVGVVALWIGTREIDSALTGDNLPFAFGGGPDAAQSVLSAITSSMITFTGVVFSVTVVALQLASSQFSPRVLRNFMRDRRTQVTLGMFIATFVYSILVLRDLRPPTRVNATVYVPRISTTMALVLLGLSLAAFVFFIHNVAQSIRASRVVFAAGNEGREAVLRIMPSDTPAPSGMAVVVLARGITNVVAATRPGYVQGFDRTRLVGLAHEHDAVVRALVDVGAFVPESGALLHVSTSCPLDDDEIERYGRAVHLGRERIVEQDLSFPIRELVDVALRALSPSLNDPTTAVQSLDQIHDLLRRISSRPAPRQVHVDSENVARFLEHPFDWDAIVHEALDEIIDHGVGEIQIRRTVEAMLRDLLTVALPDRRPVLLRELELLAQHRADHRLSS